jgi:hypothetical protein
LGEIGEYADFFDTFRRAVYIGFMTTKRQKQVRWKTRTGGHADTRTRRSSGKRGHADTRTCGQADMRTCGHADTRTCGHAGQVENADMRTRNLLNFKKSITTIINNFSRDIESYQGRGCVITLIYFFLSSLCLSLGARLVYFASFFSYRDKSRHGPWQTNHLGT